MFLLLLGCPAAMISQRKVFYGYATWYGGKFHGRRTASGEVYDMYDLTAAHRTLPFGTIARVTNLKKKKSVVVRINDRGPWVRKNIIDLSYGAAQKIGMESRAKVKIEILKYP